MLLVHQAQILNGDAGLLQGSRSSVVRASTAKVGGLGFDSQWLPKFFPSVCFYSDLPPVVYQQFLLPVVVIRIITKIVMCLALFTRLNVISLMPRKKGKKGEWYGQVN